MTDEKDMRIVKKRKNMKPEERRTQLIDVAQRLFFDKGFEDTTMADIIAEAGVSKGGFYHHFASKDELFFGLLDQLISDYEGALLAMAADETRSPVERLVDVIEAEGRFMSQSNLGPQVQIIQTLHAEKNLGMSAQFDARARNMVIPILEKLITAGKARGEFKVENPAAAADVISCVWRSFDRAQILAVNARGTGAAAERADHFKAVMKQQFIAIDQMLGVSEGTTSYGFPDYVDAIMAIPPH